MVSADGLKAADTNGKADPYVVLRSKMWREQTGVQKKTLSPTWNETFYFLVQVS